MLEDSQEEYADKWESTEVELGQDDFRDLFAHIRTIYRKDKLRGTLQKEFQDYVLGDLTPRRAVDFVDDVLDPYATCMRLCQGHLMKAPRVLRK